MSYGYGGGRSGGFGGRRNDNNNFGGGRRDNFRPKPVEVGKEYDVEITEISRRGDGIAKVEGFVIFVSGAQAGQKLKIKVTNVGPRFADAEIASASSTGSASESSSTEVSASESSSTEVSASEPSSTEVSASEPSSTEESSAGSDSKPTEE